MEVAAVAAASLTALCSALLACGDVPALTRGLLERHLLRWAWRAYGLLRRLARGRLTDLLLSCAPWRSCARALVASLAPSVPALEERVAAVALAGGLLVVATLASLLFASPVAGASAGALVAGAAFAREHARRRHARREVCASMPGVYRTLSVALASGQTLAQAVSYVGSHERGPVADAFTRMSLRLRCGSSTEEAVDLLARELDAPGAELLATALVISHRTGSPLRDLLMRSAVLAERQGEFERMLIVKTAQVRLSVRIVCLLPVVMIAILALISPDFQAGLLTPVGVGCVALASLLDGTALILIRRLMSGVMRWT